MHFGRVSAPSVLCHFACFFFLNDEIDFKEAVSLIFLSFDAHILIEMHQLLNSISCLPPSAVYNRPWTGRLYNNLSHCLQKIGKACFMVYTLCLFKLNVLFLFCRNTVLIL